MRKSFTAVRKTLLQNYFVMKCTNHFVSLLGRVFYRKQLFSLFTKHVRRDRLVLPWHATLILHKMLIMTAHNRAMNVQPKFKAYREKNPRILRCSSAYKARPFLPRYNPYTASFARQLYFDLLCLRLCGYYRTIAWHPVTWPEITVYKNWFTCTVRNKQDTKCRHLLKAGENVNLSEIFKEV